MFNLLFMLSYTLLLLLLISLKILLKAFWCFVKVSEETRTRCTKIGFFHPHCAAGGGGERVLWVAVELISRYTSQAEIIIYKCDTYTPEEIIILVETKFGITLPTNIVFVNLGSSEWIEAKNYPHLTLIGQSLGSIILGVKALSHYTPDVMIDTVGYSFTYPVFKYIGRCRVGCYVHYPTITTDMLDTVTSRISTYNNRSYVANSMLLSGLKFIYYHIFCVLYSFTGRCADVIMVNSTWTKKHIIILWKRAQNVRIVYPPCDVEQLTKITRKETHDLKIISVGQFRPEKNHMLQLKILQNLKTLISEEQWKRTRLVLVGGCRNQEDKDRIQHLRAICREKDLSNNVVFRVNITHEELKEELSEAYIGLHTMWNEHFGIGVVECLAAGLVTVAHRSGGPESDIITVNRKDKNGFLANSEEEYAQILNDIIQMEQREYQRIVSNAKLSIERFSVKKFQENFVLCFENLI